MSDDSTADALDQLRVATLGDYRVADNPQLRLDTLAVIDRWTMHAGIVLPDDLADDVDALRASLIGLELDRRKSSHALDDLIAAFVRFNPELRTLPYISHHYLKGYPINKLKYLRYKHRAETYGNDDWKTASRRFHPASEPIQYNGGLYYSEVFSAASDTHAQHCYSPWYLFHAWAWGRYWYADWLDHNQRSVCPLTGHAAPHFRRDNNADGSGLAWLRLASEYVERLRKSRTTLVRLPVPAAQMYAHQAVETALSEPGKTGTSLRVLTLAVNAERHAAGLPPI